MLFSTVRVSVLALVFVAACAPTPNLSRRASTSDAGVSQSAIARDCVEADGECWSSLDCCGSMTCDEGRCVPRGEGGPCVSSLDCGPSEVCRDDGTCGPSGGDGGFDEPGYTEAAQPRDPCEDPNSDAERERCLFEADWGTDEPEDVTDDLLVAGTARLDWIACVNGALYGTAGAVTAIGVGTLWGGAILEPTPGGEVAAAALSAPAVGFLGGAVALKVSGGWNRCVAPLARVAWTAAANGSASAARGIRTLLYAATSATTCPACSAPRTPQCRQDCVAPSAPHRPCAGDHLHRYVYVMRQNPATCECFERPQQTVTCNDHACDSARRATGRAPHNLGTYACP
jgi:hypothetical protein